MKRKMTSKMSNYGLVMEVQLLHEKATVPKRSSKGAAGFDLCAVEDALIEPGARHAVSTGVALAVPAGCYGRVAPRSGLAIKSGIDVLAGVVDADYNGEIKVVLVNHGDQPFVVTAGARVAQLICERCALPETVMVHALRTTERGANGFGSTGE